jgi:hypothetical protein
VGPWFCLHATLQTEKLRTDVNNLMMRQQYLPSEAQKSQAMCQIIARNAAAVEPATEYTTATTWPKHCTKYIPFSTTNKMQHYTIFFIAVNVLHVSGGFSAHHQELKTVHMPYGICQACLLLPLALPTHPR